MRVIKILLYIFIFFVVVIFIGALASGDDYEERKKEVFDRHCAMVWSEMDSTEKEAALNEFIEENGITPENMKDLGMLSLELLKMSVRYPETIKIDEEEPKYTIYYTPGNARIVNTEQGEILFYKNLTAKNKLNMDVRMQMQLKLKYTAGCENFEVLDFNVE